MQVAVASNTPALVQRNIRAGAMRVSQQSTPAAGAFSPCGQLVAWTQADKLRVEDRRAGRLIFSKPVPPLAMDGSIYFAPDSSYLALSGSSGVFVASLASGAIVKLPYPAGMTPQYGQCSWAPSAQSVALVMKNGRGSDYAMLLYTRSGPKLLMVAHLDVPLIRRLLWAANSRVLAMMGDHNICMLDTVSLDLAHLSLPGNNGTIPAAWSPQSWDTPHLLCITQSGEAHFHDHAAELKGRGQLQMQDAQAPGHDLVWCEHGVVVLTITSLWLFDVGSRSTGLALILRRVVMVPALTRPVLSPDQVHVCMLQDTTGGGALDSFHYPILKFDLIILNVVSESHTIISLPKPQAAAPVCSWTSRGYSLAVTLVMYLGPAKIHIYKMFSFVC